VNLGISNIVLVVLIFIMGILFGFFIHRNKIFPYKIVYNVYCKIGLKYGSQWSIGIFEGSTPFDLSDSIEFPNPILCASDITDIKASFVADPFLVKMKNEFFMFFEALNRESGKGEIGFAQSKNLKKWDYKKIILKEKFHLSYPHIFEYDGDHYIIPESATDLSVRLYKAVRFPDNWTYIGNLIVGLPYTDPSIFKHNNKWWMFVSTINNDELYLFYSDWLDKGWTSHPMNPIIQQNRKISRPAGKVFKYNNKLYRLAQDDLPFYGMQVFAFEIMILSEDNYREESNLGTSVTKWTNKGWNAAGMHHVDLHSFGDKWISLVDGLNKRTKEEKA
jgi:hypothetical protein